MNQGDDAQHDHRRLKGNQERTAAQVRLDGKQGKRASKGVRFRQDMFYPVHTDELYCPLEATRSPSTRTRTWPFSIGCGPTNSPTVRPITSRTGRTTSQICQTNLVMTNRLTPGGALQVADMFTKQIFPKHFERLRRVMMGHENFDDMCERYQDAKAAGDDVDDPKLYTVKPVRPPNG